MRLHAQQFAGTLGKQGWRFSLDTQRVVATLRSLADEIEKREVLVHNVRVESVAGTDEHSRTKLVLDLSEREREDVKP